jgi:hypothetical protein
MKPLNMVYAIMRKFFYILLFLIPFTGGHSQEVYYHLSNTSIYGFLDELANQQIIDINSVIKPYSRVFIAAKLSEASAKREELNPRQQKDLDFYLRDFNKELKPDKNFKKRLDLFYYKDSLFAFSINPILGIQYWTNNNGSVYHRWNGAEAFAYIGKHVGIYASLRDNHEDKKISEYSMINQRFGANYKAQYDYSEMRGGITLSWKWGSLGLIKDHISWGSNYNGANILSGRAPSISQIKLHLHPVKWLDFTYTHGWLVSEVVDSTRSFYYSTPSGDKYRTIYHDKYFAANIFTIKPFERFRFSFGNSIVYDHQIEAAYLTPFFFFKSIDHTLNSGIDNQNSQMFFDLSSRQIKHLHLYATLFLDEIAIGRMFDPDEHSNFYSLKLGFRLSNFPVRNIALTTEYTQTNPLVFRHYVPTLTFESNQYNLGHYLQDNAREFYINLEGKPIRGLLVNASYTFAQKGPDHTVLGSERLGLPFMENVEWESKMFRLRTSYEIINDGFAFAEYTYRDVEGVMNYTAPLWQGNTNTFSLGVNFGF